MDLTGRLKDKHKLSQGSFQTGHKFVVWEETFDTKYFQTRKIGFDWRKQPILMPAWRENKVCTKIKIDWHIDRRKIIVSK